MVSSTSIRIGSVTIHAHTQSKSRPGASTVREIVDALGPFSQGGTKQFVRPGGSPALFPGGLLPPSLPFPPPIARGDAVGRFEIGALLGQGGMGQVWSAREQGASPDFLAAIKFPSSVHSVETLKAEARVLRHFAEHHLTGVSQFIEDGETAPDGYFFIAMRLEGGLNLHKVLRHRGGQLSETEAFRIGACLTDPLGQMHSLGVGHYDLKPDNIIYRGDVLLIPKTEELAPTEEDLVVVDHGIAGKVWLANLGEIRLPRDVSMGTPAFMAPETIAVGDYDPRCDIHALGVIMYELITGRLPFRGSEMDILLTKTRNKAQQPPEISDRAWLVIARTFELDPDLRYQTMAEMGTALNNYLYE